MGFETFEPFLQYSQKGIFTLTLTSNPGAGDFFTRPFGNDASVSEYIAENLAARNEKFDAHIGMVIGATKPENIKPIIQHYPNASLLIPGIGAQGGSVKRLSSALENHQGIPLVNSSRSILYAGQHANNWQQAVAEKATELKANLQPLIKHNV
jgi:orotidine-5'-phosphate decarboxylase